MTVGRTALNELNGLILTQRSVDRAPMGRPHRTVAGVMVPSSREYCSGSTVFVGLKVELT
jgi:hypothetical protein